MPTSDPEYQICIDLTNCSGDSFSATLTAPRDLDIPQVAVILMVALQSVKAGLTEKEWLECLERARPGHTQVIQNSVVEA